MRRAVLGLVGLALLLGASTVAPAAAQDESTLSIREIDSTDRDAVRVTFTYAGERSDLSNLVVRESGSLVATSSAVPLSDDRALGIVLTIDASGSMERGALIERVLEAARSFVADKRVDDQIAIVTFNKEVRVLQPFTTDSAELLEALEEFPLDLQTSVFDGIVRSATLFRESELQPNIIVFTDGEDTASQADEGQAQAAVKRIGGALFAMGLDNPDFDALTRIAEATGGTSATADDPSSVGALFDEVRATLDRQFVVTYPSRAQQGTAPLTLSVGNAAATAEVVVGSQQAGAAATAPQVVAKPSGPAFLRTSSGLAIGLGLVVIAALAAVYSIGTSFFAGGATLTQTLQPYSETYVPGADTGFDVDDLGDGRAQQLAQTPFLQRAVALTGQLAERQGLLVKVEGLLERANLPLRAAEAIFFYGAGVVVVALLLIVTTQDALLSLIGLVIVALVPPALLGFLAGRRQKAFETLLPDTLQLLASTLRAGYSMMQGVESVSQEVSEPMGRELRRVVTEARLGRPLEQSLDGVAERMGSGDFAWAVMAIRIQREVGGNLAELLVTVADTMTERERLRRDVNALTAEGKISAIVLGLLPIMLGFFIYTLNPAYMDPLFEETIGKVMLGGSVALAGFGFWWMKKTIEIDI